MSVSSPEELRALQAAGKVVADTIRAMRRAVAPGVSTAELDRVAARVFARAGARSGPQLDYGFPGVTCISVNDEAVHGIPGRRRLRAGDLVKLDVTAELDGFYADSCRTVIAGKPRPRTVKLVRTAERALARGLAVATAGAPLNAIGGAVQRTVQSAGFSVCDGLMGHGIGRRIHEDPSVPNVYEPSLTSRSPRGSSSRSSRSSPAVARRSGSRPTAGRSARPTHRCRRTPSTRSSCATARRSS